MRAQLAVLLLTACPTAAEPQWYRTCGDPVCNGYTAPSGIPVCADQPEGDACDPAGDTTLCAIEDDPCNVRLTCATEDPTQGPGGCPISKAAAKSDIRYVAPDDRAELARQLHAIRLASYRYTADPKATPRLGFMIDDDPPAQTVFPHGERVDLYGTTSLTIAAVQEQQRTIDALRAELDALKADVSALRAALPPAADRSQAAPFPPPQAAPFPPAPPPR
jgi:hypothetical protein